MKKVFLMFCILAVLALGACSKSGSSEKRKAITIKASTIQLPTQQMGLGMKMLEENLKKELGDWVDFRGYDSAQLYGAPEEVVAVSRGDVQMALAIGGVMETISSKIQIVSMTWLFPDVPTAYKVLESGETGKQIFAPAEQAGIKIVGFFNSGSAVVSNNRHPIRTPADFTGLKLRAPGKMDTMTITAMGANAIVTPSEEVYTAIQQGVIDGMSTPSTVFIGRRFFEINKYVTNTDNMSMQMSFMIANKAWYDGLPAEFRAGFDRAVKATVDKIRSDAVVDNDNAFSKMAQEGCEVHVLTDGEKAIWKATAEKSVWPAMYTELGAELIDLARKEAGTL